MAERTKYVGVTPELLRHAADYCLSADMTTGSRFMCVAVDDAAEDFAIDIREIGDVYASFEQMLFDHDVSSSGVLTHKSCDDRVILFDFSKYDAQSVRFMFLHFLADWLADEIATNRA